jgi:hypothetical protein
MTAYLIALLLVAAVVATIAVARRLTDADGGPRPEPPPRPEEEWFPGLPSHPYATNH